MPTEKHRHRNYDTHDIFYIQAARMHFTLRSRQSPGTVEGFIRVIYIGVPGVEELAVVTYTVSMYLCGLQRYCSHPSTFTVITRSLMN